MIGLGIGRANRSPARLFSAGEQGVWYDPSDFSTMFQDSAGTTPVTTVEQPVGKMLDKSGRGNHATQATAASRPILKQDANGKYYLLFDGVDDSMATGSIDFTATDKMTVFAGVRKLSDAAQACVLALGTNGGGAGAAEQGLLLAPGSAAAATYYWRVSGTLTPAAATASGYSAPITNVVTALAEISTDLQKIRVNAGTYALGSADMGTGNFNNAMPIYIGRRAGTSLPFNGHLYGLVVRGSLSTAAQITSAETYVNGKTAAW